MKRRMPVGIEDFKEAREDYYLVDKTKFICQLIDDHKKVTLFTRPRRFGKTLTMSMLDYFFSIDKAAYSEALFAGMHVTRAGVTYQQERGTYPVIFLSLKECGEDSWERMYQQFTVQIQYEFQKHAYLLDSPALRPEEKRQIERFLTRQADDVEYRRSLWYLTMYLSRHFQRHPIVLIDEYDAPLQYAYSNGFYDEAINFFRRVFSAALKGNDFLHFAVLTGVLRIAKESIFSGLNNLAVYSVLQPKYSDVFGFTEEDIRTMLRDVGYPDKEGEIRTWYDGYSFGHTDIYNPWSVLQYIDNGCVPEAYWLHTSGNYILQYMLDHANVERIRSLQLLLEGKAITTTLREGVIYNDIERNNASLYTILLMTGYLKAKKTALSIGGATAYELQIPNLEIKQVYTEEVLEKLGKNVPIDWLISFKEALLGGPLGE